MSSTLISRTTVNNRVIEIWKGVKGFSVMNCNAKTGNGISIPHVSLEDAQFEYDEFVRKA